MPSVSEFVNQTDRIAQKLDLARGKDPNRRVFGASAHDYQLDPPLRELDVSALEETYRRALPPDYRAFVTRVGNGRVHGASVGLAGPYYGLFGAEDLLRSARAGDQPVIRPDITQPERLRLQAEIEAGKLFPHELVHGCGTLTSMGCTGFNLLVLGGPHTGRVIYYDDESGPPYFAHEVNFLDWYERWLDEILSGYALKPNARSFGVDLPGDEAAVMSAFDHADSDADRETALGGLFKLPWVSSATIAQLESLAEHAAEPVRTRARSVLFALAPETGLRFALQLLKDRSAGISTLSFHLDRTNSGVVEALRQPVLDRLATCTDPVEFSQLADLAIDAGGDAIRILAPFTRAEDPMIRAMATAKLKGLPGPPPSWARLFRRKLR